MKLGPLSLKQAKRVVGKHGVFVPLQAEFKRRSSRLSCECGETARAHDDSVQFKVACPKCKRQGPVKPTEKEAILAWMDMNTGIPFDPASKRKVRIRLKGCKVCGNGPLAVRLDLVSKAQELIEVALNEGLKVMRNGTPFARPKSWMEVLLDMRIDQLAENLSLLESAKSFATSAHLSDFRETGEPYIEHVEAVANACPDFESTVVAWLHDVVEDHPELEPKLNEKFPKWVTDAVKALTRKEDESYAGYLRLVLCNELALKVKIEDLKHNISTSRPSNRRDKYLLSLAILEYPEMPANMVLGQIYL